MSSNNMPIDKPMYKIMKIRPKGKANHDLKKVPYTIRYLSQDGYYDLERKEWMGWTQIKTGITRKGEATDLAIKWATEAYEVRAGVMEPKLTKDKKKLFDKDKEIDIKQIVINARCKDEIAYKTYFEEYLEWGCIQGGKSGRPWSSEHRRHAYKRTAWMLKKMNVETFEDISAHNAIMALQNKQKEGVGTKTLDAYLAHLERFVNWYVAVKDKTEDPLRNVRTLTSYSKIPSDPTRAFSFEELGRLLVVAEKRHAVFYEALTQTMFRLSTLYDLRCEDFCQENQGFRLPNSRDKEGRWRYKILGEKLCAKIAKLIEGRSPNERVFQNFSFGNKYANLKKYFNIAGIEKKSFYGKASFHSFKKTGVSFLRAKEVDTYLRKYLSDHTDGSAHQRYEAPLEGEIKNAMNLLEGHITEAVELAISTRNINWDVGGDKGENIYLIDERRDIG